MNPGAPTTTVSSAREILRYLHGMTDQGVPLNVALADVDSEIRFTSSLVKVDSDTNELVLHRPKAFDWLQQFEHDNGIVVTCHVPQGTIQFNSNLSAADSSMDNLYCRVAIPKRLKRTQLRASFRVSLLQFDSRAILTSDQERSHDGSCRDLSQTGAQLQLTDPVSTLGSDLHHDCLIEVPDYLRLNCRVRICHIDQTPAGDSLVGLEFQELSHSQVNAIKSAIVKIERQNLIK